MKFDSPEACQRHLMGCAARGDPDGVLEIFERNASFVNDDGTCVYGLEAIREALTEFVRMRPRLEITVRHRYQAGGDLVVLYNDWNFESVDPYGATIPNAGSSVQVFRRQEDGSWCLVFDDHGHDNH